eukprot:3655212-Rhodomonas_salina.1
MKDKVNDKSRRRMTCDTRQKKSAVKSLHDDKVDGKAKQATRLEVALTVQGQGSSGRSRDIEKGPDR